MAGFIRKYRQLFSVLSIAVASVFMLSTVSIAYTSVFCKMNKSDHVKLMKSCCHSEDEETAVQPEENCHMNDIQTSGASIEKEHKCCCEITKNEASENKYSPVTNIQTTHSKAHPGAIIGMLPNTTQKITSFDNSSGDRAPTQGRSIFILVSNFRI